MISTGKATDHSAVRRRFALVSLALAVVLSVILASFPAEARKKIKRSHYNPPSSAMVLDAYSGKILYSDNIDQPRYPASITKVMTLYILFEQIRAGKLTLDSGLKVSAEAAAHPPSKLELEPGSEISVRDAMYALATKSANDAAAVIAENIAGSEAAFARMMTQKARMMGMTNTAFRNASGLPDSGQVTTARDLVTLARRMLADFPEEAKVFRTRYFQYGEARFKNHNSLLFTYPGIEGMKTGFTQASGFNLLTSARRQDKHLIAVVLGGSSSSARNARMRSLLDQSWSKAIAYEDMKEMGQETQSIIAGVLSPDMMPERNPAFHAGETETRLMVAMAEQRKNDELKGKDAGSPGLALASLTARGAQSEAAKEDKDNKDDKEENNEDTAETDEAPAADPAAAKAETVVSDATALGPYHVQVGSFLDVVSAKQRLTAVAGKAPALVKDHGELTVPGQVGGKNYFRARFGQFTKEDAAAACTKLKRLSFECLVVRVE